MENTTRGQKESKNPSPINSPRSASSNNGAVQFQLQVHHNTNHTPPLTPIPISRSTETNPYPTTFVQADTNNFKQVVQLLTGSSETAAKQASTTTSSSSKLTAPQTDAAASTNNNNKSFVIPPIKTTTPKKQNFKLYERRANNFKNSLMINTLANNCAFSSRNNIFNKPDILSPSMLDFPKLALNSPVTPLNEDPFNKSSPSLGGNSSSSSSEEERAIAEKGFYLHPSPMTTPRDREPQLLPLFPLTSPRVSDSSS